MELGVYSVMRNVVTTLHLIDTRDIAVVLGDHAHLGLLTRGLQRKHSRPPMNMPDVGDAQYVPVYRNPLVHDGFEGLDGADDGHEAAVIEPPAVGEVRRNHMPVVAQALEMPPFVHIVHVQFPVRDLRLGSLAHVEHVGIQDLDDLVVVQLGQDLRQRGLDVQRRLDYLRGAVPAKVVEVRIAHDVRDVRVPLQCFMWNIVAQVAFDHSSQGHVMRPKAVHLLLAVPEKIELPLEVIVVDDDRNGDHASTPSCGVVVVPRIWKWKSCEGH